MSAEKGPIFDKKNVLVTGGAGFIGSHLCEKLLETSKVICIDNFITSDEKNIDQLLQYPDFVFIKADISEPLDLESLPELEKFKISFQGIQEIYNLACPTSPKQFDKFKIDTLKANSQALINVLEIAKKYNSKLVHFSSAVVYGPRKPSGIYFGEDEIGIVDQLSPRACYDEGKRFTESIVTTYRDIYNIDAKIARIFRTYGTKMRLNDGQMLPDFIVNALEGKDLVIYGDEDFSTSLCHVDDIVSGVMKLIDSDISNPVNLGSPVEIKLKDVAQKIIDMANSDSKIIFKDPLMFMTPLGLPDITLAKEKLGWIPVKTLDTGLKQAIEYTMSEKGTLGLNNVKFNNNG